MQLWAAVLTPSEEHTTHVHESALCSGVMYLQVPNSSSPIFFSDPRGAAQHYSRTAIFDERERTLDDSGGHRHRDDPLDDSSGDGGDGGGGGGARGAFTRVLLAEHPYAPFVTQVAFKPRAGDIVLFPSWLAHSVLPQHRRADEPPPRPGSADEAAQLRISYAFNLNAMMHAHILTPVF